MSVSASAVLELSGESTPVSDLLRGVARSWRLLPMLAKQDYVARYRSAALGLLWSVFLPLLQGAVLAVVFTHVVRVRTDTPSYAVFVLAGHDRLGLPVDLVEPRLDVDRRQLGHRLPRLLPAAAASGRGADREPHRLRHRQRRDPHR